jgi:O-acetyl-ADP-ribose deacetylase (regulator of RNase III)
MDVFWSNANVLALPSSQRVEVVVHDGARDFSLWPGPGPDRLLVDAYGPGLREVLAAQQLKHKGGLPMGEVVRMHAGKLHSNYLLWAALRDAEVDARQAPAPGIPAIQEVVVRCMEVAAQNASISIAFGALGEGPNAAPPEERLAAIVRAAHRYYEQCIASGRPPRIETVRVCDVRAGVTASARRLVGKLAQSAPDPVNKPLVEPSLRTRPARAASSSSARTGPGSRTRKPVGLDPNEVSARRVNANPYDRARTYRENEWFIHPKFGVGQVKRVTPEGAIDVMFEDGSTKKMLHARPG